MSIPLKERAKINEQIARITSGHFDANDVDGVLIKLRPYAGQKAVFREIADFVAHADARSKGVTFSSVTEFADRLRFFIESRIGKAPVDITKPFPLYVYRLFLSQSRKANPEHLMLVYRLSPSSLIKKIESNFILDKANRTATLRATKGGVELIGALQYVMGFLHVRPAFHLSELISELKEVMEDQKIDFNGTELIAQSDRMGLAILCLISGAQIALPDGAQAKCYLGTENHSQILTGRRQFPTDVVNAEPSGFGSLQILAEVPITNDDGKVLKMVYGVVQTDLDPLEHCHPSLLLTTTIPNEFGLLKQQIINFADDMSLSKDFKLIRSDSIVPDYPLPIKVDA